MQKPLTTIETIIRTPHILSPNRLHKLPGAWPGFPFLSLKQDHPDETFIYNIPHSLRTKYGFHSKCRPYNSNWNWRYLALGSCALLRFIETFPIAFFAGEISHASVGGCVFLKKCTAQTDVLLLGLISLDLILNGSFHRSDDTRS